ncbi:hypothetical protein [Candidatus Neptunochlamydia vexilliferae]|uniref:Uncharacterized protein n=1 Tax=Candidatus Neptunichlamydia vexilliferae TaxID=1651774 RepID=A0ABS0AZU7_9BACT|nr:hypothetical protein [Candidatus Neptunochlamydia vexilliferae]MBF5059475.1 hypothetical protein [Candidatus Neptunochlamydia vexilliferae]
MKAFKAFLLLSILLLVCTSLEGRSVKRFNFSVWTDYTGMNLKELSQEERTAKLRNLFEDKVRFTRRYNTRRALVRILPPSEYPFFNPENFDVDEEDNFYYWALELSKHSEVEVVFDPDPFIETSVGWTQQIKEYIYSLLGWEITGEPLFDGLIEKLEWVTAVNTLGENGSKKHPLIKGITIDPKELSDGAIQLAINQLDHYKQGSADHLPENAFPSIRMGVLLTLDQKELAFCNLAHFPLLTDIRGKKPNHIDIIPPEHFPSQGVQHLAPEWRIHNNRPLLDTVYLDLADHRLVEPIYQNQTLDKKNLGQVRALAQDLGNTFRGTPFVEGPGTITNFKGENKVSGLFTFFKTGSPGDDEGQLIAGSKIEIRPPFVRKAVTRTLAENPENNRKCALNAGFSLHDDIIEAKYYVTATPVNWSAPRISNYIRSRIYFVFSTEFEPNENEFFGNWSLENFMNFVYNPSKKMGFLYEPLFTNFNGRKETALNNFVIHDFTTIPNGVPYKECDWKLGNCPHR